MTVKVLIFFVLGLVLGETVVAFTDTSKKVLLASVEKTSKRILVVKESNVIYPAILSADENNSIGYVEQFARSRRAYLERSYKRSKKYFPRAVAILKKHNVPAEFAVLLALESGFNGNAVSRAGAVGYWQIMDDVAREYGLSIAIAEKKKAADAKRKMTSGKKPLRKGRPAVDDRKNFIKSTYAAAKYLRDRSRNLDNDWLLIAASYNWGVGNVWNAMQRTGKSRPTFWDIKNKMPAETRAYVMNFIAMNVIFKNYEKFSGNKLQFRSQTLEIPESTSGQGKFGDQALID